MGLSTRAGLWVIFSACLMLADGSQAVQFHQVQDAAAARHVAMLANQGDAIAQNRLGEMYASGWNVQRDSAQAVVWFRKSAEQGNAEGEYNLGVMYKTGQGVPQDYTQAIIWIRQAAAQRHALALNNLGWMYAHGEGVPHQRVVAYALYSIAAGTDAVGGTYAVKNRQALMRTMGRGEVAAAQRLVLEMQVPGNLLKAMDHYLAAQLPLP